jgi:hypothetical protein
MRFGWSYPAGCDGPPDFEGQCPVCGLEPGSCVCPVCPVCGVQGDPECYREHGLREIVADRITAIHRDLDEYAGD